MITYLKQDIATIPRGIIAHGVNCQGVMGSGVAKALRDKYPSIFIKYKEICDIYRKNSTEDWMLGLVDFVEIGPQLIVANCFTQVYYGKTGGPYADIEAVERSVNRAMFRATELNLPFYMPKIGCGLGGLSWDEVEPIIVELSDYYKLYTGVCEL